MPAGFWTFHLQVNEFHFAKCSLGWVFSLMQQKNYDRYSPRDRRSHIFMDLLLLFDVKTQASSHRTPSIRASSYGATNNSAFLGQLCLELWAANFDI